MVKEKLGKIIRQIFYVVFALLISIGLWIYVEITENELQRREIPNIEVVLRHEDILGDRGLLIEGDIPSIAFTVEASRSDIAALLIPGAVTVEIDMMSVTSAGNTSLSYEIANWPPRVNRDVVLFWHAQRIPLTIGVYSQKNVQVYVDPATAADGYMADPAEIDSQTITISGPANLIAPIDHVRVPVNRENLTTTITEYLEFLLFDEDGEEIVLDDAELESISFSQDTIRVTIPIRQTKTVSLSVFTLDGNTTSREENTSVIISPETIRIAGDPDILRDIHSITLGNIDMMSFTGLTHVLEMPIIPPEGTENISNEASATITINIRGLEVESRDVTIFQGINVPDGLAYEIQTRVLPIMIRGTQEDLAEITEMNFTILVDLDGREKGAFRVPAIVWVHDGAADAIDVVGESRLVAVRIFDPLEEPIATEP